MNDFKIAKLKQSVELTLVGRERQRGFVFLNISTKTHHGSERVIDLLTGDESFFPFEGERGDFSIVRKTSVKKLTVDAEFELQIAKSYSNSWFIEKSVVVTMTDGAEERGILLIEPREGASRPLDEINRGRGFILVQSNNVVHLLGTAHVAAIREVS